MKAKLEERKKARELRKFGLSVKKISKQLNVAQSSVSLWVRDMVEYKLTSQQPKLSLEDWQANRRSNNLIWKRKNLDRYRQNRKKYNLSLEGRFKNAKNQAKYREINWGLTLEEFKQFCGKNCYYCVGKVELTGSGLDRVDSNLGYILLNCVPCCKECNRVKGNVYNVNEMKQIAQFLNKLKSG